MTRTQLLTRIKAHFCIQELVTPERYEARKDDAWNDLPTDSLRMLLSVREAWGKPIIVNNWHTKGALKNCGLRDSNLVGAKFSGHLLGLCYDLHVIGDMKEHILFYNFCKENYLQFGITEIENAKATITKNGKWIHISCRPTSINDLVVIDI